MRAPRSEMSAAERFDAPRKVAIGPMDAVPWLQQNGGIVVQGRS